MQTKLAKKYFAYVAKHFPVMCASGAFPLLPPVTDSARWMDRLDDFSHNKIAAHVTQLSRFHENFLLAASKANSAEDHAVARTLALSASGAITELDAIRTWEKAPELYLTVAFTGLEQAADTPAKNERARQKRFIKRLREIPRLLRQAMDNVDGITSASRSASQTLIRECAKYLSELEQSELGQTGKAPRFLQDVMHELKNLDRFITNRPEVPGDEGPSFEYMAEHVLGTDKSARQAYDMAEAEWNSRLESLKWIQSEIGSGKGWRQLYDDYEGPSLEGKEALDAVVREIHRLRRFFTESALPGIFADTSLRIAPQPLHMASSLRPIHHDPTLGAYQDDPSRCYISKHIFSGRGFRDNTARLARARKEFPFWAASQTYPGRHLLDSQRRALGDSPLSQITNPLFMAGWLAFAENLLEELGYLVNPLDRLVHHRRGLARAGLAMIDAGLAEGIVDQEKCLSILDTAGYTKAEGLHHILKIRLAPAKRAMAIIGFNEIADLRKESGLELGPFCTALFSKGQLPFNEIGLHMGLAPA